MGTPLRTSEVVVEEDPPSPEVDTEEDLPGSGYGRGPPRSEHRRGPPPPQKWTRKRTPPRSEHGKDPPPHEVDMGEDQLRSTAGQVGGMP